MKTKLSLLTLLTACAAPDNGSAGQAGDVSGTEQVATLSIGETHSFAGGAKVTIVAIPSDSRCPSGVQCIWAGSAAVAITLSLDGADTTATVNSGIDPKTYSFRSWHVVLRGVTPGPSAGQPVPTESYRVTVGVGRD